ncbi:MAG: Zn-ribbon domain-containing OB-fold protein [Desulfurococcales archaeon]|nr:Zn-ribbon domain-containing OB-fold protein [Desulfurococcales archaeon]
MSKEMKLSGHYLKEKELQTLPGLVEYRPQAKYRFTAGAAQSRFLKGLKEGKILGVKCPRCGRVYVPPRVYCEYCFAPTSEWVELPGTGEVHTAVVSYISTFRERMDKPEIVAVVKLDAEGYTPESYEFAGMFHKLCNVTPEDVMTGRVIGMKVKPRWRPAEQRTGSVNDIECFEPVEG